MSALLLVLLAAEPRLLGSELKAETGPYGAGYATLGSRAGDALWALGVSGRAVLHGASGELQALALFPLSSGGATAQFTVVPRLGYSGERWSLLVGASVQLTPAARPVAQVLPSVRAQVRLTDAVGLSLGLFDLYGQVPLHLSAELGDFSIGYVAPLGFVASARLKLTSSLELTAQGFVYRLFNAEAGLFTLGLSWEAP